MIVGLLIVLKAGRAFLFLDVTQPVVTLRQWLNRLVRSLLCHQQSMSTSLKPSWRRLLLLMEILFTINRGACV